MRLRIPKKVKRIDDDQGPARKKRKLNEKLILILDIDHTFLHASRNPQAYQVLEHENFKDTVHKFFLSGIFLRQKSSSTFSLFEEVKRHIS